MILVLDNVDSFVHNLARYLGELGAQRRVVRSHEITVDEVIRLEPEAVVLSPGPCGPDAAGVCLELADRVCKEVLPIPLLGVCLGHQAVVQSLGGRVLRAQRPVHGRASPILHDGDDLFDGLPSPMTAGRYHSLVAEPAPGGPLRVTARTPVQLGGEVMAVAHAQLPVYGVQFHPESLLTPDGHALLANFLRLAGLRPPDPHPAASTRR